MRAFVDTSAFIALIDADDPQHNAALAVWRSALQSGTALVTTNYVALETVAALQRRFGLTVVSRFVGDVLPAVSLEWVADDDHAAGLALLLGERRRKLSWVDCVSFVVMRRLNIGVAFSLDPHFAQQGFELVPEDFLSEGSATAPG